MGLKAFKQSSLRSLMRCAGVRLLHNDPQSYQSERVLLDRPA